METQIKNLEINMAELKTDLKYIKDGLLENKEEHREILKTINDFITASEARFASKWVERFLIWAAGIIGVAILGGVITLLAQSYLHLNK
jgi:hypothetical protein